MDTISPPLKVGIANGTKKTTHLSSATTTPERAKESTNLGSAIVEETELTQYHLVLFQGPGADIDRRLFRDIQEEIDAAITTSATDTAIDVWLESPGGDAHSAYKIFLELRSRCSRLRVVVPDYAKSAATLLLLGADAVYMSASAELGPLDVQIEHPDREGKTVSGLDVADSLE